MLLGITQSLFRAASTEITRQSAFRTTHESLPLSIFRSFSQSSLHQQDYSEWHSLTVTTTENIPDKNISKILGVVHGTALSFEPCGEDWRRAYKKMIVSARHMSADAVIGVRYDSSTVRENLTHYTCYGTAVTLKN